MTREELARILEQFAILVLKTGQSDIDVDTQYECICGGINTIVEAVMFCSDRSRIAIPSTN